MDIDVFLRDSGWDDPYAHARRRPDGCRLNELLQGIADLLAALNSSEIEIQNERDFLKIAAMYDRPWWRFVDCKFSYFSYEKSQIRLVLWDCEAHSTTLKFRKNKWIAGSNDDLDEDDDEDFTDASDPDTYTDSGIGEDLTDEDQEYAILAEVKDLPDDVLNVLRPNEIEVDKMEENEEDDISIEAIAALLQEEGYRAKVEDEYINSASLGHDWTLNIYSPGESVFLLFRSHFVVKEDVFQLWNDWNAGNLSKLIVSDNTQTVCLEKSERIRDVDELVELFETLLEEWESDMTDLHHLLT
jgi:hypothetical protein